MRKLIEEFMAAIIPLLEKDPPAPGQSCGFTLRTENGLYRFEHYSPEASGRVMSELHSGEVLRAYYSVAVDGKCTEVERIALATEAFKPRLSCTICGRQVNSIDGKLPVVAYAKIVDKVLNHPRMGDVTSGDNRATRPSGEFPAS
jgi:hypothetical protein